MVMVATSLWWEKCELKHPSVVYDLDDNQRKG